MRLLVTRPQPDGERMAVILRARGHEVTVASLLRIEPVEFELEGKDYSAVVMTSANAARMVAQGPLREKIAGLPALTVGRHTAEAARAAGFSQILSAEGSQQDLVRLLRARFAADNRRLLYLAGEDRAAHLAGLGVPIDTAVIYRAVKTEFFPPEIAAGLSTYGGVLHFSRRSAQTYLDCANRAGMLDSALAPVHFCLSRQVAEPLAAAGAGDIRLPARPAAAALLDLVNA
jgi:uroporphyrinogen-III synthase